MNFQYLVLKQTPIVCFERKIDTSIFLFTWFSCCREKPLKVNWPVENRNYKYILFDSCMILTRTSTASSDFMQTILVTTVMNIWLPLQIKTSQIKTILNLFNVFYSYIKTNATNAYLSLSELLYYLIELGLIGSIKKSFWLKLVWNIWLAQNPQ